MLKAGDSSSIDEAEEIARIDRSGIVGERPTNHGPGK